MEDAIVAAVRAEREGAVAIVCAPILSSVIEQLVRIPVATIIPRESVQRAIELAARKAWI
jgi:predicted transcriptional regulator